MFKALLATAFAALAFAQDTSSVLSFTRVPNPVTAGQPTALTYATNDTSSPVSILLRKGNPQDLTTVATLTDSATNGQYIWTPSESLQDGSDYALEIKQGNQVNYFGPFQLQGSKGTGMTSSSAGATGYGGGKPGQSTMSSMSMTAAQNSSMTAPASAGTGTSMPRNTTMSHPTLAHSTKTATQTMGGSNTQSTGGAGFQGSQTGSGAPAGSTGGAALLTTGGSAIALVFGAVAAVFFC